MLVVTEGNEDMKHLATLILLAVTALPAIAQAWLAMPCADASAPRAVPTTAAKPICLPAPQGAGTAPVLESNEFGAAAAWWCKRPGKEPLLYLYAVRWDAVTTALVTDLVLGALSSGKTAAIQNTTAKHQTMHVLDMCDVWGPAASRIAAAKPL